MMWKRFIWYFLYIVALSPVVPAVITMWPHEASKVNRLGYYSVCSFAPWSTLIFLGGSFLLVVVIRIIQVKIGQS